MNLTPYETYEQIREALVRYIETQYKIGNRIIYEDRGRILRTSNVIAQVPFIESTPSFATNHLLSELEQKYPHIIPSGLSNLVQHGVPVDRNKLYTHQESALLNTFTNKPNLLVASGTGSGKTEAFLLPILAKMMNEAKQWLQPQNSKLLGEYDPVSKEWLHSRRYENRPAAIRSIILYPMNALVNDQLTRLRRILSLGGSPDWQRAHLNGNLIHFGMYTSLTPMAGLWNEDKRRQAVKDYLQEILEDWDRLPDHQRILGGWPRPNSSEMTLRWDMQAAPPDILVTNYSMLEYMLLRPSENGMFEKTKNWIKDNPNSHFTLVLDEAHTYSGAKGSEVAHLIRRLKERLGIANNNKFQAIATTASVPKGSDEALTTFTSTIFGCEQSSFELIRAEYPKSNPNTEEDTVSLDAFREFHEKFKLEAPEESIKQIAKRFNIDPDFSQGNEVALYRIISKNPYVEWFRDRTARNATPIDTLSAECWGENVSQLISRRATAGLLAAGSYARSDENKGTPPVLSIRLHAFFRGISGVWACMNPNCSECESSDSARPVGKLYFEPQIWCSCGSRILEVFTCRHCGLLFLGGIPDSHSNSLWPWSDTFESRNAISEYNVFCVEEPHPEISPTYRSCKTTLITDTDSEYARKVYEVLPATDFETHEHLGPFPTQCPRCHNYRGPGVNGREVIENLRTKGVQSFATIVQQSFRHQQKSSIEAPNFGRKILVFSDSRREASKLATDLKHHHFSDSFRQAIYLALYGCYTCLGAGDVESPGKPQIGQARKITILPCPACEGKKINSNASSLPYQELKRRVTEILRFKGIDISNQRLPNIFEESITNIAETEQKIALYFNSELRNEITHNVFGLQQLGLAHWIVPPMYQNSEVPVTEIGKFFCMSEQESYLLIQLAVRLLSTENVVTSPSPHDPWDWGRDASGNIVEIHNTNVLQRLHGKMKTQYGVTVIPFNATENRKLGRFLTAVSKRLIQNGRIPNDEKRVAWLKKIEEELWDALNQFEILTSAGASFPFGSGSRNPRGIKLDRFVLFPNPSQIHKCSACQYTMPETLFNVCLRCGQETRQISIDEIDNYFTDVTKFADPRINTPDPYPFKVSEHTAQVNPREARNEERWFQDIFHDGQNPADFRVDGLSVTTTMEMGIDIGSLLFVGLRNVPPTVANYQQRAGRAGRRGSSLASVFTFTQQRSHDQYYFHRPKEIVSDPPRIPALHFDNEVIARRHFRSLVLQRFFVTYGKKKASLFDIWGNVESFIDEKLNIRLSEFIRDNKNSLLPRIHQIISPALHSNIDLWFSELSKEITAVIEGYAGNSKILPILSQAGLLPKYAFPVDVVSLSIPQESTLNNYEIEDSDILTRDLKIAISEYAPGSEITRQTNQVTYKYKAVGLHDPFDKHPDYSAEGVLVECKDCKNTVVVKLDETLPRVCAVCQSTNILRMEYITPKGFTVDGALNNSGRTPYKPEDGIETSGTSSPVRLLMGETSFSTFSNQKSFYDERLSILVNIGNLIICNKGVNSDLPGFILCPNCGRMLDPDDKVPHRHPADVPPNYGRQGPRIGHYCKNRPPYTISNLILAHRFHSEVCLLGVNLPANLDAPFMEPSGAGLWYSFGTLLANASCILLQIDPSELRVGVRPIRISGDRVIGEVFIYDDVPGGAGYARSISSKLDQIIELAYQLGKNCTNPGCAGSCYNCLLDYRNQQLHSILNRKLGVSIIEFVLFGKMPGVSREETTKAIDNLSDYLLPNFEIVKNIKLLDEEFPLGITDIDNRKFAINVIHPLQARKSPNQNILLESGYEVKTFTTFDLERRPFWVLNNFSSIPSHGVF